MPDMTIYKTDRIESIEATIGHILYNLPPKRTGFCEIKVQNIDQ